MPGKKQKFKDGKLVHFQLVSKAYDDPTYDEGPSHVWVPAEQIEKHSKRYLSKSQGPVRHTDPENYALGDDGMDLDMDEVEGCDRPDPDLLAALAKKNMPEDFSNRRNMLMVDDTKPGDEDLFNDAEEVEFGEDFIKQLIYGDPGEEDAEDALLREKCPDTNANDADKDIDSAAGSEEDFMANYPRHDVTNSVLDQQFDKMMHEFAVDSVLNDADHSDARAQGALHIEQYAPVLEEFADENARTSYLTDEPIEHRGLLNGLRKLTRENRYFDMDDKGMFLTSVLPDKATRMRQEFRANAEENRINTLKIIQRKEEEAIAKLAKGEKSDGDNDEEHVIEYRKRPDHDCETILTTYSTLYNHPNIIAAAKKKLNPDAALRQQQREARLALRNKDNANEANGSAGACSSSGASSEEDDGTITIDISQRPKDETEDEKRLRKKLIKQMKREKRSQKKELGRAYKHVASEAKQKSGVKKQQKAQISLSMATRI